MTHEFILKWLYDVKLIFHKKQPRYLSNKQQKLDGMKTNCLQHNY